MGTRDSRCDRARDWASLRADGELSELESALLAAHLKRCDACASFARGVEDVSARLRAAPLEGPPGPIRLAPRRAPLRAVHLGAAAALVAAAVGLGNLFGSLGTHSHASTLTLKLPPNAGLLALDVSPRGLPTTRQAALAQKPPAPIPRSLALPDV
jgi:ferric-dicitrate binding protein FerR (iron transport regulator)